DKKKMLKTIRAEGGLFSHLGTTDAREVEARIDSGDIKAALVYEAMALNVAKNVAKLAVVVCGRLDAIILTGGLVFSKRLSTWVSQRVEFLAPVVLMPGENEMKSLSRGALRILRGQESARVYTEK
ncbi:MAG: butyrate kinase, partial [Candidatus Adiutrix sp.]